MFDRLILGASWAESRGRRNLASLLKSLAAHIGASEREDLEGLEDRVDGLDDAVKAFEARLEQVEDDGASARADCPHEEVWAVEGRLADAEIAIARIERELVLLDGLIAELTDNAATHKTRGKYGK
ncbi:MAG: hypothetical protein L0H73_17670 [Nitrococcus sp.]|nr:hypothetical protein [Nitrococcus sp.]